MRTGLKRVLIGAVMLAVLARTGPAQQRNGQGKQTKAKSGKQTAKTQIPAGDWPMYSRDLASTRYSPLAQIDTGNVSRLTQVWSYSLKPDPSAGADSAKGKGKGGGISSEATPIVVNGTMYVPAGSRVVALDAETGKEIWRYQLTSGQASGRGVGYWPGDQDTPPHVVFLSGRSMMALNANTGKTVVVFGLP